MSMNSLRMLSLCLLLGVGASGVTAGDVPPAFPAFPTTGILPKTEIGALRFLKEHPEFDGRGVVVAIFDTGIDPGAAGLQTTTDGKPKFVDFVDGTGSGDVVLGESVTAKDGKLTGVTGRTLTVDPKWQNPTGKFRLGMKRGYALFPSELIKRLEKEHREQFERQNRAAVAKVRGELEQWDASGLKLDADEKRLRDDLQVRLEVLEELVENYEDPGPLFDVLVFHDGELWRAVVDTDEDGDFRDETALADYRAEQQFATFPGESLMNYTVRFTDDGAHLSIVTAAGSHGTHVAGIVAAHFPEQPELNGIAPGAQLVSVKIGDTRLNSMETGTGLVRGIVAALELDCDLVNMSYGEPTSTPNRGELTELFTEAVHEHGLIFIASAGNSGPALSTVGAPGGTTSALIGVGAYLSPELAATAYAIRQPLPGRAYPWTSRGPAADGDFGVDVFAPGGAIAPVPRWTLNRNERMNGTSMASPNACGAVALLLSGLKQQELPYSPESVRRALESTAEVVATADDFAQGAGLIQVDKAFEHLTTYADAPGEQVPFRIRLPDAENARGIYLREPHDTHRPSEHRVEIRPGFPESAELADRADFAMRFTLVPSAEWITCGRHLLMTDGGETLAVHVDPTRLAPGAYREVIRGYDALRPGRPAVFRIPVTVVVPATGKAATIRERPGQYEDRSLAVAALSASEVTQTFTFQPGELQRMFAVAPPGATWADVTLRLRESAIERTDNATAVAERVFLLQTVQLVPGKTFEKNMRREYLSLRPQQDTVFSLPVEGGRTLDVSLVQNYISLGESAVDVRVQFFGLRPSDKALTVTAGTLGEAVQVTALSGAERLQPEAKLDRHQQFLAAEKVSLRPSTSEMDKLPARRGRQVLDWERGPIYEMIATYRFEQPEPGDVTFRFPKNDDLLYDSPIGSQLLMVFDAGKRLVATDDIFPEKVHLERGAHTVRLQLRHTDPTVLEAAADAPLIVERPLKSAVTLKFHHSRAAAADDIGKIEATTVAESEQAALFLAAPAMSDLPDRVSPGDRLTGTIFYAKAPEGTAGAGRRPGGWPLVCYIPVELPSKPEDSQDSDTEPQSLADAVREAKVEYLKSLTADDETDEFEALFQQLRQEYPGHLPILVTRLHRLDTQEERKENLEAVVKAADAVIEAIDTARLRHHYGVQLDPEDSQAAKERAEFDRLRDILTDALYRKGRALGYMELPEVVANDPIEDSQAHDRAFEETFEQLNQWVDTTDRKWGLLRVRRERRREHFGHALKLLNEYIEEKAPDYWHYKKRRDIYEQLGWKHAADNASHWLPIRFPKEFEPF